MTKPKLLALGLTHEQTDEVMQLLNGNFVTKARFNEVNVLRKQLKKDVAEKDKQLQVMKQLIRDVENQIVQVMHEGGSFNAQ